MPWTYATREASWSNWEQRFWGKVNKNGTVPIYAPHLGPCWEWDSHTKDGYGYFSISSNSGRSLRPAHRLSYELAKGEIPEGLVIDHLCRVRHCVNPDHLEPVTDKVNILRGAGSGAQNARKTHCKHGHEFTPENTGRQHSGRYCRTCGRAASLRSYYKRKKEILADC